MDFLDKLYSSNYFGIGLFAVIAFLVVTFLVVLFFGKKDEKKRKLEATQSINAENTFKETSTPTPVEIPKDPEPVAPINLEPAPTVVEPVKPLPVEPVAPSVTSEPVTPVMPVPPIREENNDYVDNLTVEEPAPTPVINTPKVEPIITPVTPIVTEEREVEAPIKLEPTKIEIPAEPVRPVIDVVEPTPISQVKEEPVIPVIKEEEPVLQINEEPVINTYYQPAEKPEAEQIKVPNIDFDALAKSISKGLDELENDSKKYDEIKVTPMREVTNPTMARQPETFSSVYVREEPKETPREKIELPKRIDLPARKSE